MAVVQIPNLPAVAALSGAELLEAVQAGSSVKVSLAQIGALFQIGAPVSFPLQVAIGGTGTTTSTGTGSVVLSNSPTLVSPTLGTASFALGSVSAPSITFTGDTNTGIWSPAPDTLAFSEGGIEIMRINSAGNVGIGTTSPTSLLNLYSATSSILTVAGDSATGVIASRASNDATSSALNLRKARGTQSAPLIASANDVAGNLNYSAYDGSGFVDVAQLQGGVDAPLGANDVSGYFRVLTRPTGTLSSLTERMRITATGLVGIGIATPVVPLHVAGASMTTGVVYQNQPAQTSLAVASTLTIAQLLTGIIQYTGALATLTLPTGALIEAGLPATFPTDMSFDVSVINTGSGTATLGTASGLTLTGSMAVTAGASGLFRVRKTATSTYTVYRIC